jgi:nucleotide sugar dehydrogenase
MKIGIIGKGFVGESIYKSFKLKNIDTVAYDRFKESDTFEACLNAQILFLCLPTEYDNSLKEYDKSIIIGVCKLLEYNNYSGIILIKSTVEPNTTNKLAENFKTLNFIHNPEFLSAVTAFEDFHEQKHIVLGNCNVPNIKLEQVISFYKKYYPSANVSVCSSIESESMKIFCNSFYAVKVQFFNELYDLCKKTNMNYDIIKNLMLKNNWINPNHTSIPGPDGKLSYGGYCFPKDTNALLNYMKKKNSYNLILDNCIKERNLMRDDHINCKIKPDFEKKFENFKH